MNLCPSLSFLGCGVCINAFDISPLPTTLPSFASIAAVKNIIFLLPFDSKCHPCSSNLSATSHHLHTLILTCLTSSWPEIWTIPLIFPFLGVQSGMDRQTNRSWVLLHLHWLWLHPLIPSTQWQFEFEWSLWIADLSLPFPPLLVFLMISHHLRSSFCQTKQPTSSGST